MNNTVHESSGRYVRRAIAEYLREAAVLTAVFGIIDWCDQLTAKHVIKVLTTSLTLLFIGIEVECLVVIKRVRRVRKYVLK